MTAQCLFWGPYACCHSACMDNDAVSIACCYRAIFYLSEAISPFLVLFLFLGKGRERKRMLFDGHLDSGKGPYPQWNDKLHGWEEGTPVNHPLPRAPAQSRTHAQVRVQTHILTNPISRAQITQRYTGLIGGTSHLELSIISSKPSTELSEHKWSVWRSPRSGLSTQAPFSELSWDK